MVMPVAQMDELTDENLVVIVNTTQTAIPKDQIDRIDTRPPQRRRPRAEPCGLIEGR